MKVTKRQLKRIVKEGLTQSQRATAAYAAQHRGQRGQPPLDSGDINLPEALDAYISEAIQDAIDETGADPNLPAVRSSIEKALNDYITRNYR